MKEAIEVIYDFAGNRICVGDTVVCIAREKGYGKLTSAKVVAFSAKMVELEFDSFRDEPYWVQILVENGATVMGDKVYGEKTRRRKVKELGSVRHNAVFFMRGVA